MEAEILDLSGDTLHEQVRRARIEVDFARTALQRARDVEAMVARGVAVADGERANVAALEQTLSEREEHARNLRAMLDGIESTAAAAQAEREAAEAKARRIAIEQADKALLRARREQDKALVARLDCATSKATDAEYSEAVDKHVAAVSAVTVALAQREALEEVDDVD